jgi:hypothetical protein
MIASRKTEILFCFLKFYLVFRFTKSFYLLNDHVESVCFRAAEIPFSPQSSKPEALAKPTVSVSPLPLLFIVRAGFRSETTIFFQHGIFHPVYEFGPVPVRPVLDTHEAIGKLRYVKAKNLPHPSKQVFERDVAVADAFYRVEGI